MISSRIRKQLHYDVTSFFGSFRDYSASENQFHLSLGEVVADDPLLREVFSDPEIITKRLSRLLRHYPGCQGYEPLNEKIAELISLETGEQVEAEEIVLALGGHDALAQTLFTVADQANSVCFPTPSFPFWNIAQRVQVNSIPLFCNNPQEFTHTVGDQFCKQLGKSCSALILNVPHNPYGVSISKDQREKINDHSKREQIPVILDDLYRAYSSTSKWIGSSIDPEQRVVIDSFSKRFGLPGLRLGFMWAPKDKVPYFRAAAANQYVGVNMASVVIADLLLEIFLSNKKLYTLPQQISQRQQLLERELKKLEPLGISVPSIEGGMYRVIYHENPQQLQEKLAQRGVIVKTSESSFPHLAKEQSSFIRLSVGAEERIPQACEIIKECLEKQQISKEKVLI